MAEPNEFFDEPPSTLDETEDLPKEERKFWNSHGSYLFPSSYSKSFLPPNIYRPFKNADGKVFFDPMYEEDHGFENESYFPLENYNEHLADGDDIIRKFLSSKDVYEDKNLNYKRSILFYGETGSGKSQYVTNQAKRLVRERDAAVFQLSEVGEVRLIADVAYKLHNYLHDRLKVLIVEELPKILENKKVREEATYLFDHAEFREDLLILSTGNHPELLPENFVKRSGRIDFLIPVYGEDNDIEYIVDWYEHLMGEEFPGDLDEDWVIDMADMPPATTENIFTYHKINRLPLKEAYQRMKRRNKLIENEFKRTDEVGF